jgi:hypothetical protein
LGHNGVSVAPDGEREGPGPVGTEALVHATPVDRSATSDTRSDHGVWITAHVPALLIVAEMYGLFAAGSGTVVIFVHCPPWRYKIRCLDLSAETR